MTYKYGTAVLGYGSSHWLERPPRNLSRSDVLNLTLYDGGHGDPTVRQNPILRDIGMTVILELNQYVRTFTIELQHVDNGGTLHTRDLRPLFTTRDTRRFEMRTFAGDPDGLGFAVISDADYDAGVEFKIVMTFTNINRTSQVEYVLNIASEPDPARCDVTDLKGDFEMFELLHRAGFRWWENLNDPTYDLDSAQNLYLFMPDISQVGSDIQAALNFQVGHHTGIAFTRDAVGRDIGPGMDPNDGNIRCL